MVFARLQGLWRTQVTRSGQFHMGNRLSTTRSFCVWSRSSLNTPLLERAPGRRAVSSTITKNPNALRHHKGRRKRTLTTLDPDRLLPDDLLDLSGSPSPRIWFREMNDSGESLRPTAHDMLTYKMLLKRHVSSAPEAKGSAKTVIGKRCPFPDNTHGFLYFRRSPHPHPDAGEIRFRLVRPEDDGLSPAERFRRGSDLMNYEGLAPWKIHTLNTISHYPVLRKKLVEEGLVPQVAEIRKLSRFKSNSRILESITEPFIFHFGNFKTYLTILREESTFSGKVHFGCSQHYAKLGGKGTAWVRFEMSNLPRARNLPATAPGLVIRVLKFIEAPTLELPFPTGQIFKEGELIQSHSAMLKGRTGLAWALTPAVEKRILTPSSRKLLEDTYLGDSPPN